MSNKIKCLQCQYFQIIIKQKEKQIKNYEEDIKMLLFQMNIIKQSKIKYKELYNNLLKERSKFMGLEKITEMDLFFKGEEIKFKSEDFFSEINKDDLFPKIEFKVEKFNFNVIRKKNDDEKSEIFSHLSYPQQRYDEDGNENSFYTSHDYFIEAIPSSEYGNGNLLESSEEDDFVKKKRKRKKDALSIILNKKNKNKKNKK